MEDHISSEERFKNLLDIFLREVTVKHLDEFESWAFGNPVPVDVSMMMKNWNKIHGARLSFKDEENFLENYDMTVWLYSLERGKS